MNIAVNARMLLKNKLEGIGWFSNEILKRIVKNHPEHKFYFIFDRSYDNSFIFAENIVPIVVRPPTRHPILTYIWFQILIPKVLKKIKADLFLSTDGNISLYTKIPQINVIHDINFYHNPSQLPFFVEKYYNLFFPKFARKAQHLLTVSQYSKQDISKIYNIDENKITVCYNAAKSIYKPIEDSLKIEVKNKYTDGCDYFVFVGALNPRKNVCGLLKSFDIYKKNTNSNLKLIIVGSAMHLTKEIDKTYKTMYYKKEVIFTGRLELVDLHKVMASATALVYIPFFEGFGIPLVEAMACEVPIISGNTSSLPEVVGDAALLVDVSNYEQIAENMKLITYNQNIRIDLKQKEKLQKEKFSWERSAEIMWDCINFKF